MALLLLLALCFPDAPVDVDKLIEEARAKSREGASGEAAKIWEKVAAANPYQGQHWMRLGEAYRGAKQFRQAIKAYEEAQRLGAGMKGSIAYALACCHAQLKQTEDALRWLQRALEQGWRRPEQIVSDSELESLRDDARYQKLVAYLKPAPTERVAGWRHDLAWYWTELKRRHPDLHRLHTPAEFDEYIKKLHDDIPSLNDAQLEARFIQLGAMAGSGHTALRMAHRRVAPVELYQFEEGIAVASAAPDYAALVGGMLVKVGEHPVQAAVDRVKPLISQDNAMAYKAVGPMLLARPRLLYGLGMIPSEDEVTYTVKLPNGTEKTATVKTIEVQVSGTVDGSHWVRTDQGTSAERPLYLKERRKAYWFEHLPAEKLVFCQYNGVRNEGAETFAKFCERLFKFIEENHVEYLVLDIRWNGGGNSFLNRALIEGLVRCPRVNQTGKLFVVIGRQTFSAAQNCATDLELHTRATFVGEPTGSSPNSIGESVRLTLPYSKMTGSIADLRWWRGWPMDERVWIPPHLAAPPTLASIVANRDPAMEAIRAKIQRDKEKR